MKNAIETTMDRSGRLVIPKSIREAAGIEAGTPLHVVFKKGVIEISPKPRELRIVKKGLLRVAVPVEASEPLRTDIVDDVIEHDRVERGRG